MSDGGFAGSSVALILIPRRRIPGGLVIFESCGVPGVYMSASEAVGRLAATNVTVVAGEEVGRMSRRQPVSRSPRRFQRWSPSRGAATSDETPGGPRVSHREADRATARAAAGG